MEAATGTRTGTQNLYVLARFAHESRAQSHPVLAEVQSAFRVVGRTFNEAQKLALAADAAEPSPQQLHTSSIVPWWGQTEVLSIRLASPLEVVVAIPTALVCLRYGLGAFITLAERIATFRAKVDRDKALYEAQAEAFRAGLPPEVEAQLEQATQDALGYAQLSFRPQLLEVSQEPPSQEA